MISRQLKARGIVDERVLAAMAAVPRERFVPADSRDLAYADQAVSIGSGQTISQPWMVALMSQLLDPPAGRPRARDRDRFRLPGGGARGDGCNVLGIERLPGSPRRAGAHRQPGFWDRVEIRVGDGSLGAAGRGAVAANHRRGSGPGRAGRPRRAARRWRPAVIPVGGRWEQELILVERLGADLITPNHGPAFSCRC